MDPVRLLALFSGVFFLAFGLAAYRQFFKVLGATAGVALWVVLREPLIGFPGIREHPGTASLLILILFCASGILLVPKFRRLLAFLGGVGTGIILSGMVTSFFSGGSPPGAGSFFSHPTPMDLLSGLVAGTLFLLFERFFAVLLTSSVGGVLCSWAIGGRWTFLLCLIIGLVAQPLIFSRVRPNGQGQEEKGGRKGGGGTGRGTGSFVSLLVILTVALPSVSTAEWVVERVVTSNSRVVMGAGWRNGARQGEQYAVVDPDGELVTVITLSDVFSDASYSEPLDVEKARLVEGGMRVQFLEEFKYKRAMESGRESVLLEFLGAFPQSRYRTDIVNTLDEVRFRKAEMEDTVDSYIQFQKHYPTSRFASQAARKGESLAFREARTEGSEEAFRGFLNRFPGTSLISGMPEVKGFLRARATGRVDGYRDFVTSYPHSPFSGEFQIRIDEFERWADRLEYGPDPLRAVRFFGENGDGTAVPLLVGKLSVPGLKDEARDAIFRIGEPALDTLLEVLISPMQTLTLKDQVALIIGEIGDVTAVPAMRSYVGRENTPAGRRALLKLEERAGR